MEPASYNSERQGTCGQGGQWVFGADKFTKEDNARIQKVSQAYQATARLLFERLQYTRIMFPVCSVPVGSLCPAEACAEQVTLNNSWVQWFFCKL